MARIQSTALTLGNYSARTVGHGEIQNRTEGPVEGQGFLNRLTGSEFWLIRIRNNQGSLSWDDLNLPVDIKSQQSIKRGNLSGKRIAISRANKFSRYQDVACDMEIFIDRGAIVMLMYVRGSEKAKASLQSKSRWESWEDNLDNSESFFESLNAN